MLVIDYPVIVTLVGLVIIGISSGILSCFAVLRHQSLLGDAISHAVLPGLCIAFILTLSKHSWVLLMGGLISGLIGTLFITLIIRYTILKSDTALGIILSIFFGFGIFLLTIIQKIPTARQSGLDTFLFGSAASILASDLYLMGICLVMIIITTIAVWKEFKCFTFDPHFSVSLGYPIAKIEFLMTILLVITIVIGLQSVGVILMSALIIAPGVAARQWTNRLSTMVFISIIISCLSGIVGVLISSSIPKCPTGPIIVVIVSVLVIISLLLAPNRGLIIYWMRQFYNRKRLHQNTILSQFFLLAQSHDDLTHPHNINTLELIGGKPTLAALIQLKQSGFVYESDHQLWGLTENGIQFAKRLQKEDAYL